jgi:hypothetical protein
MPYTVEGRGQYDCYTVLAEKLLHHGVRGTSLLIFFTLVARGTLISTLAARGRTTENARAVTRCAAPERWGHPQASRAIGLPGEEAARHPA